MFNFDLKKLRLTTIIQLSIISVLCISNIMLVSSVVSKRETILQSPLSLCKGAKFTDFSMDEGSHKLFGYTLATVLGNVNPSNVDYVRNSILSYANSSVYNKVNEIISLQLDKIKTDEVVMTYHPDNIIFEDGKVFITGLQTIEGLTGKKRRELRTYEFIFKVNNYQTSFVYINTYQGKAHTIKWNEAYEQKNK
ncbi:TraE/TraK family type IV conjugative transfer system protein [Photobacterium aquae]|nr:TraE/TraK family type IV conjugative transfer system protein [Photobacterium aquae]